MDLAAAPRQDDAGPLMRSLLVAVAIVHLTEQVRSLLVAPSAQSEFPAPHQPSNLEAFSLARSAYALVSLAEVPATG